jgi:hypothetical protein
MLLKERKVCAMLLYCSVGPTGTPTGRPAFAQDMYAFEGFSPFFFGIFFALFLFFSVDWRLLKVCITRWAFESVFFRFFRFCFIFHFLFVPVGLARATCVLSHTLGL